MEDFLKAIGAKTICSISREDVIKSMITDPDKWTKEQIIEFLKNNFNIERKK